MKEIKDMFGFGGKIERKLYELIPPQIWSPPRQIIFYDGTVIIQINFTDIRAQTNEYIEASD